MSSLRRAVLVSLGVWSCTSPPKPPREPAAPAPVVRPQTPALRLPAGVWPTAMAIHATVVPSQPKVAARVTISLHLEVRTDRLWLNATRLELSNAQVDFSGKHLTGAAHLEGTHFAVVELDEPIGPGEATLTLDSSAEISHRDSEGLFAGQEGADAYVYTQFEPISARRAWPCFDEPGFKVPWQLTLTVPTELVAVSNTPVEREETNGALKTVTFARTQPLPSYLLALAVGPFELVDGGTAGKNQVPVRIITPRGQKARAAYAAEVTGQVIEQLEAYFGTPYPFEKADQLAVASSTYGGAMENAGLITWSPSLLLSGAEADTVYRRREYLQVAAHELAHQWFGNLVTLAWWDDLWLNESFAQWMESRLLAKWKPEWHVDLDTVEERDLALQSDSLVTARSMRQPISSHDDVLNAFDAITYSKGAAVLSMFERWLGEDVFQRGVRRYLEQHARKTATAQDFLAALGEAAGRDVTAPFRTFLDQPGSPLVSAELRCEGDRPTVRLGQQRFLAAGVSAAEALWQVPVCLRWSEGQTCVLLDAQTKDVTLEAKGCPAWLVPNAGATGYYRARPLGAKLLGEPAVTAPERIGLAGDLSALVHTGEASVVDQLSLIPQQRASGVRQLISYATWPILELDQLVPPAAQTRLAALVQREFGPAARRLGFAGKPGEAEEDVLLRPLLLRVVGEVGADRPLRAQAAKLAKAWLADRKALTPDVVAVTLGLAAEGGDPALFEAIARAAVTEPERRTRRLLLAALGQFREPGLVKKAQALVLSPALQLPETMGILWSQLADLRSREQVWTFVTAHYDELAKRLPEDQEASLVSFGTAFCTKDKRLLVEQFFEPRTTKAPGGPRDYANALEEMDQCIAWRAKQIPAAVAYLQQRPR